MVKKKRCIMTDFDENIKKLTKKKKKLHVLVRKLFQTLNVYYFYNMKPVLSLDKKVLPFIFLITIGLANGFTEFLFIYNK